MGWIIYALRIKGEMEARYIGQTSKDGKARLCQLTVSARRQWVKSPFAEWLLANEGELEAVVIGYAGTLEDARNQERTAIQMFSALGHRLFNRQGIHPKLRIGPWAEFDRRPVAKAA